MLVERELDENFLTVSRLGSLDIFFSSLFQAACVKALLEQLQGQFSINMQIRRRL